MKVAGPIESLTWNERSGKLKLATYERTFWVDWTFKAKLKGLEAGDLVTVEAKPGPYYDRLVNIERGEAAPLAPEPSKLANGSPPAESTPKTDDFNIPYSLSKVGELYPILMDPEGNVVDGLHRLAVKKEWRKEVLPWVRSRKDFLVARIHANLHRRTVPKEERQKDFTELANILHKEGVAIGELASKISELTGFDDDYVRLLLPRSFKLKEKVKAGKAGGEAGGRGRVPISDRQLETLPEAKVDLDKEAERIAGVFKGAPSQVVEDLSVGPCPYCGQRIRWDQERKVFAKAA